MCAEKASRPDSQKKWQCFLQTKNQQGSAALLQQHPSVGDETKGITGWWLL
jgi:hypothetical protein